MSTIQECIQPDPRIGIGLRLEIEAAIRPEKVVMLRGLRDGAAAARLVAISSQREAYVSVELTAAECEALSIALDQCAREKRAVDSQLQLVTEAVRT